jgi:hypothetical protein
MGTADDDIALQREAGIKKALEVTRLLGMVSGVLATCDDAVEGLRTAATARSDPKLTHVCGCVEKTMSQLKVLLTRAAGSADVEEFDKVRGAVESMIAAMRKATKEAEEEAQDAAAVLVKTIDASDEAVGLPRSAHGFRVPRLVEDTIVLVVDGRPLGYDRAAGEPWRPLADVKCACAHVLSGGREVFVSKHLHASPDGRHRVTFKHNLCHVDRRGVGRVLPGKLKGTCLLAVGGELVAVGDDGALYKEHEKGKWAPVYDGLRIANAAIAYDRIVVVTHDGRVLETRIDDDLACLNPYTTWTEVPGTAGLGATSVGFRAPVGMTLAHPKGRVMRVDDEGAVTLRPEGEELVVRASKPELLHNAKDGYFALDVHSGPGAGRDSLMHFNYALYSRPFKERDFTYSWKFVKDPSSKGYFVYNDFAANSWLGHDRISDAVVIVNADSVDRIAWTVTPPPEVYA